MSASFATDGLGWVRIMPADIHIPPPPTHPPHSQPQVEEHPRRLRDAINTVHLVRALGKESDALTLDREAWEARAILGLDRVGGWVGWSGC